MTYEVAPKECAQDGCTEAFKSHAWGAIKAHNKGWFHQKDGRSWCPSHIPDWVTAWRAQQKEER